MNDDNDDQDQSRSTDQGDPATGPATTGEPKSTQLLREIEARVLGALMEKQLSTPDAYPLTVKSLMAACNQKSSREPVSNYQQGELVRCLRELESRAFVRYEMGSRAERYEQRFTNQYSLSKKQQALMTIMLLRGPQTANELLTRTQRMYEFSDRDDMQISLDRLTQGDEPMVVLIPRGSGQREDRYGHLLCGTPQMPEPVAGKTSSRGSANSELIAEVALLRQQLDELYELTGHSKSTSDNEQ